MKRYTHRCTESFLNQTRGRYSLLPFRLGLSPSLNDSVCVCDGGKENKQSVQKQAKTKYQDKIQSVGLITKAKPVEALNMFCGLNNCESYNRNLQNRKLAEENDLLQSSTLLILCVKVSPPRMCLQVSDVKAHTHKPIQSDLPMTPLQNLLRITTRMNFTSIKVTPTSPTPYTSTRLHLHSYTSL